jgi:hypothetical protein
LRYFAANVRKKREAESSVYLAPPKQKGLDLLGFIRPNRAFSMGYSRKKNKKIFPASPHGAKRPTGSALSFSCSSLTVLVARQASGENALISINRNLTRAFRLCQELACRNRNSAAENPCFAKDLTAMTIKTPTAAPAAHVYRKGGRIRDKAPHPGPEGEQPSIRHI